MIRVGVLGYASIARRSLIPAFTAHPDFELVAIGSRSPEKISGAPCRVCSYDELVSASDVDLVYCALPTGLHYEWVKKAIAAHKHVLCEKSLVCRLDEARELVDSARAEAVLLVESFQFRFHAQNIRVKELLAAGAIGELRQLVVRFGVPPFPEGAANIRYSAELGGGALLDNGAYAIKCATYLLGPEISVIAAMEGGADPALGNVNVFGSMMLQAYPQPPYVASNAGQVPVHAAYGFDHYYQNGYELWGTKGKIFTSRAFTARSDFPAPVVVETEAGREQELFRDDHFARMLDHVSGVIRRKDFEEEYGQCLLQAELIDAVGKVAIR